MILTGDLYSDFILTGYDSLNNPYLGYYLNKGNGDFYEVATNIPALNNPSLASSDIDG